MALTRIKITSILVALAAAFFTYVPVEPVSAQQGGGAAPAATLRAAAVWFGPLPTPSLFSSATMERIEQLAVDNEWPMPDEIKPWPLDAQGNPIVTTRQIDELWHTVGRGKSKHRLREMFGGRLSRIEALNPGVDLDNLEEGQEILVWQRDTAKISQSVAAANRGRVSNGEPLPPGDNYVVMYPHRAFGTYYTISEVVRVLDAFAVRFPEASPVIMGDLSFRNGKRIRPHKSHQSGRDIDITYPRVNEPPNYRRFHPIRARDLDVPRTLWMLKSFIAGGQVEYMFVDRHFQRLLIREAEKQGAPQEWIDAVFQYPNYSGTNAIVRHARGHRTHVHIRFKCQETDRSCR